MLRPSLDPDPQGLKIVDPDNRRSGSSQILSSVLDPDPHQHQLKNRIRIRIRIHIKVIRWIRIRIRMISRIRIRIKVMQIRNTGSSVLGVYTTWFLCADEW
jgi:hypothetical protein